MTTTMQERRNGQSIKRPPVRSVHQASDVELVQQAPFATVLQRTMADPRALSPQDVLQLQRTLGNRAVGQLLARQAQPSRTGRAGLPMLQAGLAAGAASNPYEQEAGHVAQRVMRVTAAGGQPARSPTSILQRRAADSAHDLPEENKTGLPADLRGGIENLSGLALDDVRVHYNSAKPAQIQALAYTQGADIHVGPGQEKHLAHEAWHVVQQKQGRVHSTMQLQGTALNNDSALEREADAMGARAAQGQRAGQFGAGAGVTHADSTIGGSARTSHPSGEVIQRVGYAEFLGVNGGYKEVLDRWLEQRVPSSTENVKEQRALLLHGYTADELKAVLSHFERRMIWDTEVPDIDEKQIETYVTESETVKALVKLTRGEREIKKDHVHALNDRDFQRAYMQQVYDKNPTLKLADLEVWVARRVDLIDGFTHKGEIYVRAGLLADEHVLIHEAIHFFGHDSFERALGHPINEGTTELLAQEICRGAGVAPRDFQYQREITLVDRLMRVAGVSKGAMIAAYFTGDVSAVRQSLEKAIGGQNTQVLADKRDAAEALSLLDATLKPRDVKEGPTEWVDLQDASGQSELHRAAKAGDLEKVNALLGRGARPDLPDRDYRTPLLLAAGQPNPAVVKVLLQRGANAKVQASQNLTPLHLAMNQDPPVPAIVNLLLNAGADINGQILSGATPLHLALEKGHHPFVVPLLPKANVLLEDVKEETLLMVAARKKAPAEVLKAIGQYHQVVTQDWMSIGKDVAIRTEPDEKAASTTLSKFSTAYLIKSGEAWHQVVYVGEGFAIGKCYIKKSDPVHIK